MKKNPIGGLHNAHPKIQERVRALPAYQRLVPWKPLSTPERLKKKLPAAVVAFGLLVVLVRVDGAHTFWAGFLYSFILWATVKLYVVFVLDMLWYAHSPKYWIPGTEDMAGEYRDYKFYMSSVPRSLLAGAAVAATVGGIVAALG